VTNLKDVPTCELFEELKKREGVETLVCPDPSWDYFIAVEPHVELANDESHGVFNELWSDTGPAAILVVID
jgi:general stress protein 26